MSDEINPAETIKPKSKRGGYRPGAGRKPKLEIREPAKAKLSVRQQRVIHEKLKGKSDRAALVAAGYSESTASKFPGEVLNNPAVQSEFQRLLAKVIPDALLIGKLRAGLMARRKTYANFEGRITDERIDADYVTQHKFLDLACRIKNVIPRDSEPDKAPITVQIVHIAGDVVSAVSPQSSDMQVIEIGQ